MLSTPAALTGIKVLQADHTVFLLFNPLSLRLDSIDARQIIDGAGWSRTQWEKIIKRRDSALGKRPDPTDIALRVDYLPSECEAWKKLARLSSSGTNDFRFVDCCNWRFLEADYLELPDSARPRFLAEMKSTIETCARDVGCWDLIEPFFN